MTDKFIYLTSQAGPMDSRSTFRRLLGAPLALAALVAATALAFITLHETSRNSSARRELWIHLGRVQELQQSLTDAETGQRGFLLTGDLRYLEPYDRGVQLASKALEGLRDHPALFGALKELTERKLAELSLTIQLRQQNRLNEAQELVRSHDGKRTMDQIRALCRPAIAEAEAQREQLNQRLGTLARRTFIATAIALLLGLASILFAQQQAKHRQAAQRTLQWQEARYRSLVDRLPVGIFELDQKGNTLYRNTAQRALFGFEDGDPQQNPWRPLIHPDDLPHVSEVLAAALRDVRAFSDEYRIRKPGEPDHWVRVEGRPSFGPDGEHLGYFGTLIDIHSEKAQMLAAKEAQEAHHRAFFELAAAGLALADLSKRRFISVNEAMCQLLGYDPEALMQLDLLDLTHPDDRARSEAALQRAVDGEIIGDRYEKRYRRRNGAWIWVDLSFVVMRRDEEGSTIAATIAVDITERKSIEAEMLALNAELENRVTQRTRELTDANRELEAFSYSVSHDLRAPLRHLDGFAGLLERHLGQKADEKTQHYLHRISDAARTMGALIDDLLSFSRMSRQELRAGSVDLDALIKGLTEEYPTGVAWSIGDLGRVQGDASMLRQAFRNLLSNAVKFSRDKSSPSITVTMEAQQDGRRTYCVQDNGVGFDMTYRDKLFGVFQRLHPESQFEGTGIGLAIVARVVHRHGGEVWAESTLGQGARFYLSLPALAQGEAA